MRWVFRSFARPDADAVLTWRYEPPYDEYDPAHDPRDVEETLAAVGSATWFAVDDTEDGSLAGFLDCRIGEREIEVGLGLRPDLTGHGLGPSFVEAIVELVRARWGPALIAVDVLPWNERAIRAYERAGFARGEIHERTFEDGNVRTFLRMARPL
jgi:ribosomal-protein-alanine N-acetyltransferase